MTQHCQLDSFASRDSDGGTTRLTHAPTTTSPTPQPSTSPTPQPSTSPTPKPTATPTDAPTESKRVPIRTLHPSSTLASRSHAPSHSSSVVNISFTTKSLGTIGVPRVCLSSVYCIPKITNTESGSSSFRVTNTTIEIAILIFFTFLLALCLICVWYFAYKRIHKETKQVDAVELAVSLDEREVEQWLDGLGMSKYFGHFVSAGYVRKQLIEGITEKELNDIGISVYADRAYILRCARNMPHNCEYPSHSEEVEWGDDEKE